MVEDDYIDTEGDVMDYPVFSETKSAVRRIGNRLAGRILISEVSQEEIRNIFRIANHWRVAHAYAMGSIRRSIQYKIRALDLNGVTSCRLKSMVSIRKKLARGTVSLDAMNDLAGCRAIVEDIAQVRKLRNACLDGFRHPLRGREYDYITCGKDDGYRSHHMVFSFSGNGRSAAHSGRRVEFQIRTRLQHSWATAVEAVGLFRNEDIKGGQGNSDWRHLFRLMSQEFALAEGFAPADDDRASRIREIKALNNKLNALHFLDNIKKATHIAHNFRISTHGNKPNYYVLRYDHALKTVDVIASSAIKDGAAYFDRVEQVIDSKKDSVSAVFVQVDKIEKLAEAYPAYFGDVTLFIENLQRICGGYEALEYSMAPPQIQRPKERDAPIDPSWLWAGKHRRWL